MLAWDVIKRRHDRRTCRYPLLISFPSNFFRPYLHNGRRSTPLQSIRYALFSSRRRVALACTQAFFPIGFRLRERRLPRPGRGALSALGVNSVSCFGLSTVDFQPSDPPSPFPATLPRNPPVSLIIATLPKMHSRKPFDCHTSETPRGLDVLSLTRNLTMDSFLYSRKRVYGGWRRQDTCGKRWEKVHPVSRYNQSMGVRLIALVIDGTLLDSRWQLPEANRAAIAEATRRGIEVALVTGRRYDFAMPVARKLDSPLTMIVNNGALIRSKEGRTHLRPLRPKHTAAEVLQRTREWREGAAVIFDRQLETQLMLEVLDPDD